MTGRKVGPYLVALVITVLLIMLAYFVFFVPQQTKTKDLNAQKAAAEATNAGLQSKVAVLSEKRSNMASLKGQVDNLTTAFPPTASEQDLFASIQAAAGESGVTITTLNPVKPVLGSQEKTDPATAASASKLAADGAAAAAAGGKTPTAPAAPTAAGAAPVDQSLSSIAVIYVTVIGDGTEDQLRTFLGKMEALKRPLSATDVQIKQNKDKMTITITGRTFLTKPLVAPTVKPPAPQGGATPAPSQAATPAPKPSK